MSLNRFDRSEKGAADTRSMLARAHELLADSVPLIGVGGVRTRADVEAVLQDADAVAIGQQLLYDPTWAVKLAEGLDDAMLTADFEDALKFTPLNQPLHDFALSMVQGRKTRQAAYRKQHPAK